MNLCFFFYDELFHASGSAVLYRRVLAELCCGHRVTHVVCRPYGRLQMRRIARDYQAHLPGVKLRFIRPWPLLAAYTALKARRYLRSSLLLPGLFWSSSVRAVLDEETPAQVWWSMDHPEEAFSILYCLREYFRDGPRLHLSVLDPPEMWWGIEKVKPLYQECGRLAASFDCIGLHLQTRLQTEFGKPAFILSDFIEEAEADFPMRPTVHHPIVAVAGRLYAPEEFQELVDLLGRSFRESLIQWFGFNTYPDDSWAVNIPPNVALQWMGLLPRHEITQHLARCSFGYLSMPAKYPEFARYSLPTKIVTYCEAWLPVAFHAPEDAEVHALNQRYGFGLNLSQAAGRADIRALAEQPERFLLGVQRLRTEQFSRKVVLETIHGILAPAHR